MSEKHNLLIEETRQSFFELESLTISVDNKAYGMIAFIAVLVTISVYITTLYPGWYPVYLSPALLVVSLLFALLCIYPREWFRPDVEESIKLFESMDSDAIAMQLSASYVSSERSLSEIYINKFGYLKCCLLITICAIVIEFLVLAWCIILDP